MNISIDKAIEWQLDLNASAIYKSILERDEESFQKLKTLIKPGWFLQYLERLDNMELVTIQFGDLDMMTVLDCKLPAKKRVSKKNVDPLSFDAFVLEYYECFPADAYTGDYKIRSGLSNCKKKLKTFITQHKNYSKELIIQATRLYIENKKRENYAFTKIAPNFIMKDGYSLLESMCESLLKGEVKGKSDYSIDI